MNEVYVCTLWNFNRDNNVPVINDIIVQSGGKWQDVTGQPSENLPVAPNVCITKAWIDDSTLSIIQSDDRFFILARQSDIVDNFDEQPTANQLNDLKATIQTRFSDVYDDKLLTEAGEEILQAGLTREEIVRRLIERWKLFLKALTFTIEALSAVGNVVAMQITASEEVTGFAVGDITITGGPLANFATADNTIFTVDWTLVDGVNSMDIDAGVCADVAGNPNLAATQFTIGWTTLQPDAASGEDTWIDSVLTTKNYGTETIMRIGERASGSGIGRGLIKFDLSPFSGKTILGSQLSLLESAQDESNERALQVFRSKRAWVEGQATWNIYSTGNSWQTAGGFGANDCEQTAIGSVVLPTPDSDGRKTIVLDPTKIQEMVDDTFANNGFLLKMDVEDNDRRVFRTSDYVLLGYPKFECIHLPLVADELTPLLYVEQKLGIKLNWDMRVFTGDPAPADEPVDTWNPTGFDYEQWIDTSVNVGAKYAMVQAKHVVGFAMWPTAYAVDGYDPYSIAQTTWYANNGSPDVVGLQVAYARAQGLNPCFYFSIWDGTWEVRTGTDETTNAAGYIAMILAQLTELLTNYGDITAIWFDAWRWKKGYDEIPFSTIYNHIKGLQPNCVVIDNSGQHPDPGGSEIEVYEAPAIGSSIPEGNTVLAEEVDTIRSDGHWVYIPGDDPEALRTADEINTKIANAINNTAAYLLAVQPGPDGLISDEQLAVLAGVIVP